MVAIPESHIDLLTRPIVVTLVTVMPDGQPQATPVWADVYDGNIRINTAAGRQKYKNLHERPIATVCVMDPENPYYWMEVRGKVVYESEGDDRAVIDKLAHDYTGSEGFAEHNDAVRRVTFLIEPTHITKSGK